MREWTKAMWPSPTGRLKPPPKGGEMEKRFSGRSNPGTGKVGMGGLYSYRGTRVSRSQRTGRLASRPWCRLGG